MCLLQGFYDHTGQTLYPVLQTMKVSHEAGNDTVSTLSSITCYADVLDTKANTLTSRFYTYKS
jgi:hypothetical protein